jgi:hypothetical protein
LAQQEAASLAMGHMPPLAQQEAASLAMGHLPSLAGQEAASLAAGHLHSAPQVHLPSFKQAHLPSLAQQEAWDFSSALATLQAFTPAQQSRLSAKLNAGVKINSKAAAKLRNKAKRFLFMICSPLRKVL